MNIYPSLPKCMQKYAHRQCACAQYMCSCLRACLCAFVSMRSAWMYACVCLCVSCKHAACIVIIYYIQLYLEGCETECTLDQSQHAASNAKGLEILIAATIPLPPTPISKAIPRVRRMMRCKRSKCASRFTGGVAMMSCSCKQLHPRNLT